LDRLDRQVQEVTESGQPDPLDRWDSLGKLGLPERWARKDLQELQVRLERQDRRVFLALQEFRIQDRKALQDRPARQDPLD
jgi:hypothetical protein